MFPIPGHGADVLILAVDAPEVASDEEHGVRWDEGCFLAIVRKVGGDAGLAHPAPPDLAMLAIDPATMLAELTFGKRS